MKKILAITLVSTLVLLCLERYGLLASLFSANYLPHRYCYLAKPGLIWTNVVMDFLIALSYAVIFSSLFWIASRLRSLEALRGYLWIVLAFGTFIVACGATHLMEVVTVWWPIYPLSAAIKIICAAASVPTAILFARVSPVLATNIHRFIEMLSTSQQEKEQAVLALVASDKLAVVGRISASIAHEIKNPLDSVGNILYLIESDARLSADMVATMRMARTELSRASAIAGDTLSLFHNSPFPVPLDLSALIQGILDLQKADLAKRSILVECRMRTTVPITAYSGELRQIVINLLQNAVAVVPPGGRILIRVQLRQSMALWGQTGYSITIADTGSGIRPVHRDRLFTLFFTTKGDKGTGLGLWLVRSMVEKHGGRIRVRSRTLAESPRSGTIFNIWLPLEPTLLAAARIQGEASAGFR